MKALRRAGCHVEICGTPVDLSVQLPWDRGTNNWHYVEIKPPEWKTWRMDQPGQVAQKKFCKRFKVPVVQSETDALRALAII